MGKHAYSLIIKIIGRKDKIVFSDSLIWELRKAYQEKEIFDMLNFLFRTGILIKVEITNKEHTEAKKFQRQSAFEWEIVEMIKRYTRAAMGRIWEPENIFSKWLQVEIAACEAMAEEGMIPEEAVKNIKEKAGFSVMRILEIEVSKFS